MINIVPHIVVGRLTAIEYFSQEVFGFILEKRHFFYHVPEKVKANLCFEVGRNVVEDGLILVFVEELVCLRV